MQDFTTELYSNGMVAHPSGWDISVDNPSVNGWTASVEKHIFSEVFEQAHPQYARSEPRMVWLTDERPYPNCNAATKAMWEWLDKHAAEIEESFVKTGTFNPGANMDAFIPLSSCVKEKPALSLEAEAGF